MSDMRELVDFVYDGAAVKRYHTARTLEQQTVGAHSFGVAMMCYILTAGRPSAELLMGALSHDLAEHKVGDIPSPTKRATPGLAQALQRQEDAVLGAHGLLWELNPTEARVLKLADYMDGMVYCCQEAELGNTSIAEVYYNFHSYAAELLNTPHEKEIFTSIARRWEDS